VKSSLEGQSIRQTLRGPHGTANRLQQIRDSAAGKKTLLLLQGGDEDERGNRASSDAGDDRK